MDTGSLSKSIYNNFEESTGNAQFTSYAHDSKKVMDMGSLSKSGFYCSEESTGNAQSTSYAHDSKKPESAGNAQFTSYAHDSKKVMDMGGLWKSGFYYSEGSIGKAKFDSDARESKKGCLDDVWRQRLLNSTSAMFVPVNISSKYTQDAARSAVEEYNKDQLEAIELKTVDYPMPVQDME